MPSVTRDCRLEDLVAHDDIISILTNLIDSNNLPHLLLYGPPGTGKASLHSKDKIVLCVVLASRNEYMFHSG